MSNRRPVVPLPPPGSVPQAPAPPVAHRAAFNVLLSDEDYARLDGLALVWGMSRGAVIRRVLQHAHAMSVQGVPMCASGGYCPVPQMHTRGPVPPTGTPGQGGA